MSDVEIANEPPKGHIKMVYLGPVAPHWETVSYTHLTLPTKA